jgi:hypothetical protein
MPAVLMLIPALKAADRFPPPAPPSKPRGIYAVVNVDEYLATPAKNPSCASFNDDEYFSCIYQQLLSNPAVSGMMLVETWKRVLPYAASSSATPSAAPIRNGAARPMDTSGGSGGSTVPAGSGPSTYDWGLIDNLFLQTQNWNSNNPEATPKTVQLVITPGFNSPEWLLDELESCNFLFDHTLKAPPKGDTCGKATFNGYKEGGSKTQDGVTTNTPMDLPLPWNATYKSAWQTFLTVLAARYGSYPEFVTIGVAGPTASSDEIRLPTNESTDASATQIGGLMPKDMWSNLLAYFYTDSTYQNSDKAFVDEWKNAIDMYGKTFSGITLDIATGSGLPKFPRPTSCPSAHSDCASICPDLNTDCLAESEILSYFAEFSVGGSNAKAVQTDGMKGFGPSLADADLGVPAVKWLSQNTWLVGGAQFAKSFSTFPVDEGWPTVDPPSGAKLSPEQAAYNVLANFFSGTAVGPSYGQSMGAAPMNYLQIYGPDIQYANDTHSGAIVNENGVKLSDVKASDLLQTASTQLLSIAE